MSGASMLGMFMLGVDLPGEGDGATVTESEDLLGDILLGWGMLGGDGATDEIAGPVESDRTVQVHGDGDVINVATLVDRTVTVDGDGSVLTAPDRTLTVNGDARLLGLVDRTVTAEGTGTLQAARTYSFDVTFTASTMRDDIVEPDPKVAPLTTYYT